MDNRSTTTMITVLTDAIFTRWQQLSSTIIMIIIIIMPNLYHCETRHVNLDDIFDNYVVFKAIIVF